MHSNRPTEEPSISVANGDTISASIVTHNPTFGLEAAQLAASCFGTELRADTILCQARAARQRKQDRVSADDDQNKVHLTYGRRSQIEAQEQVELDEKKIVDVNNDQKEEEVFQVNDDVMMTTLTGMDSSKTYRSIPWQPALSLSRRQQTARQQQKQ